jgi:hypothetical protein
MSKEAHPTPNQLIKVTVIIEAMLSGGLVKVGSG